MARIVSAKMLGLTKLKRKLERMEPSLEREVRGMMTDAAETVETDVKRAIQNEPKSGRFYTRMRIKYQASAPGEAPAYATGHLFASIKVKKSSAKKPTARLVADGVYRLMEYGTRLMAARPAFVPAMQRNRKPIIDKVTRESRAVFKRFART